MFQTEVNHFVQSFASTELTAFMRLITSFGYGAFFALFLFFLLLAVDFKKVALLFLLLSFTTVVTLSLKAYFNLPRPFHVDSTLARLDGQLSVAENFDLVKGGAPSFWAYLPVDVLQLTRQVEGLNNGFPSGHATIAIVFWGALALLFRKRWLNILSVSMMVLIPFSRIYLGVHFLADVIGGLALGAVILAIFYNLMLRFKEPLGLL